MGLMGFFWKAFETLARWKDSSLAKSRSFDSKEVIPVSLSFHRSRRKGKKSCMFTAKSPLANVINGQKGPRHVHLVCFDHNDLGTPRVYVAWWGRFLVTCSLSVDSSNIRKRFFWPVLGAWRMTFGRWNNLSQGQRACSAAQLFQPKCQGCFQVSQGLWIEAEDFGPSKTRLIEDEHDLEGLWDKALKFNWQCDGWKSLFWAL